MAKIFSPEKTTSKKSGQILVLMAMMSTTLMILFGMVVGIGHIVEAKMNLQNAVDLAAMAGASQQARHLNNIALINYRMRQNYKFMLYDLYVTESRFNVGLNSAVRGASSMYDLVQRNAQTFGVCQQAYGYYPKVKPHVLNPLPAGSIYSGGPFDSASIQTEPGGAVDTSTDMCQNVQGGGRSIPPITPNPVPTIDPILLIINQTIINLASQAQQVCKDSGDQNGWYLKYMIHQFIERQNFQAGQLGTALTSFSQDFDLGTSPAYNVLSGQGSATQAIAQTFQSNLISANANQTATLTYIGPPETRGFFDAQDMGAYQQLILNGSNSTTDSFGRYFQKDAVSITFPYVLFQPAGTGGCVITIELLTDTPLVPMGISRTRSQAMNPVTGTPNPDPVQIPFEMVLQATTKPNLLFWPKGLTPTLVAVGAAKPFGSRVGPPVELSNFEINGTTSPTNNQWANMSFYPGDYSSTPLNPSAAFPGIGHKHILQLLLQALRGETGGSGVNDVRPSILTSGTQCGPGTTTPSFLCYSLAPTLYEGFFWNTYPFPIAENSSDPAIQSIFPSELGLQNPSNVADISYDLPDRMNWNYNPGDSAAFWHYTSFMGFNDAFRDDGYPVFFADYVSGMSSWSPDYQMPGISSGTAATPFNPQSGSGAGATTSLAGRMGYQIKLVAVSEVCKEIATYGSYSSNPMSSYCQSASPNQIVH